MHDVFNFCKQTEKTTILFRNFITASYVSFPSGPSLQFRAFSKAKLGFTKGSKLKRRSSCFVYKSKKECMTVLIFVNKQKKPLFHLETLSQFHMWVFLQKLFHSNIKAQKRCLKRLSRFFFVKPITTFGHFLGLP